MTLISQKFNGNIPFNFPPTSPTWTISPFRFVAAPTTLLQICQSSLLQTHARFKIYYKIQTRSSWCILSPWNFWLLSIFVVLCKAPAKEKQKNQWFMPSFLFSLVYLVTWSDPTRHLCQGAVVAPMRRLSWALAFRLQVAGVDHKEKTKIFFVRLEDRYSPDNLR